MFILIFDIPRSMNTLKVQTWRMLKRSGCKMVQFSVWKSEDINNLMRIASFIKNNGGSASILEEKFVF